MQLDLLKCLDDESKTDDFKKIEDEFEEAQPIIDEVDKDFETIRNKLAICRELIWVK